jgi:hypothetical protein
MTVVINEFEVVPETAAAPAPQVAPDVQPAPSLSAPEVEKVVSHLAERALRVWAH